MTQVKKAILTKKLVAANFQVTH